MQITTPPATPELPLVLTFLIDASLIPPGENQNTVVVFRNGVPIKAECPGASQAVPNDPCVSGRTLIGSGDVQLAVLTSQASESGFGASICSATPLIGCTRNGMRSERLIGVGDGPRTA